MWIIKFHYAISIAVFLLQKEIFCHVIEPRCSKFDYEERLLEKMVRLEHSTNNMMVEFKEISLQVKDGLTSTKTELTETRQQLEKDQDNSSRAIEQFESLSGKIRSDFENLKHDLAETKKQIEQEKQDHTGVSSYAFNAQWIKDESPSTGDTLIFTRVPLNQNDVYSSATGEYTVPVDGTYMFSMTLCTEYGGWVKIKVLADATVMHVFYPGSSIYMCTSTSTVGQLKKGVKVKVVVNRKSAGRSDHFYQEDNDRMCTFSGFLIK